MSGVLPFWTAEIIVPLDFARSTASIAGSVSLSPLPASPPK